MELMTGFEPVTSSLPRVFIKMNSLDFTLIKTEYFAIGYRSLVIFYINKGTIHKQIQRNTKGVRSNDIFIKSHTIKPHMPICIIMGNDMKICQSQSGAESGKGWVD